ncbi:MAG: hypothetical protein ABI112_00980 [Terracoccus sp.]
MSPARMMIFTGGAGFAGSAVFDGVGVAGFGLLTGFVGGFGAAEVVGAVVGVDVGTEVVVVGAGGALVTGGLTAAVLVTLVAGAAVSGAALHAVVSAMDSAPSAPSAPFMTRARPRCCCMVTP